MSIEEQGIDLNRFVSIARPVVKLGTGAHCLLIKELIGKEVVVLIKKEDLQSQTIERLRQRSILIPKPQEPGNQSQNTSEVSLSENSSKNSSQ